MTSSHSPNRTRQSGWPRRDQLTVERVVSVLREVVQPTDFYCRAGYPRGGGIDRLVLSVIKFNRQNFGNFESWRLFPGGVTIVETGWKIPYEDLFFEKIDVNVFIRIAIKEGVSSLKYSPQRDKQLAEVEVGVLAQALHSALSDESIENRVFAGYRKVVPHFPATTIQKGYSDSLEVGIIA